MPLTEVCVLSINRAIETSLSLWCKSTFYCHIAALLGNHRELLPNNSPTPKHISWHRPFESTLPDHHRNNRVITFNLPIDYEVSKLKHSKTCQPQLLPLRLQQVLAVFLPLPPKRRGILHTFVVTRTYQAGWELTA